MEKFFINAVARQNFHDDTPILILVFLCLFLGGALIVYSIFYYVFWNRVRGWVEVRGLIDQFDLKNELLMFRYKYIYNGVEYFGDRISLNFHRKQRLRKDFLGHIENSFENGGVICIYVNSAHPSDSYLDVRFDGQGILLLLFVSVLALVAPLFFYFS